MREICAVRVSRQIQNKEASCRNVSRRYAGCFCAGRIYRPLLSSRRGIYHDLRCLQGDERLMNQLRG